MFEVNPQKCTACGACINACPAKSIAWSKDKYGFFYPKLNRDLCIECGLCSNVCPVDKNEQFKSVHTPQNVYASYTLNKQLRYASSSGGIFSVLAKHILEQNGVVYGAAFDEFLKVVHIGVRTEKELKRLRGSKYVQSFIREDLFVEIKKELEKNITILFSGTPCQVAGLKLFLNKNYSNLITVDLICHGVPPQSVFDDHIKTLEKKYARKVAEYDFRNKKRGWKYFNTNITWHDGSTLSFPYMKDPWMKLFLHKTQPFLRESCYQCQYAQTTRCSDITLGDFWNFTPSEETRDTDEGMSCVICNTVVGQNFYDKIIDNIKSEKRTLAEAVACNYTFSHPTYHSEQSRRLFFDIYNHHGFAKAQKLFKNSPKQLLIIFLEIHCPVLLSFLLRCKRILKKIRNHNRQE